jgi:hypothetical protein
MSLLAKHSAGAESCGMIPPSGRADPCRDPADASRAAHCASLGWGRFDGAAAVSYAIAVALCRIQPNPASGIVGSARNAVTPASSSVAAACEVSASAARVLSTTEAA